MPSATFEYWDGDSWEKERNYTHLTLTDILHAPKKLSVTVVNYDKKKDTKGNDRFNARETTYNRYQQVRITEGNSNQYIFYGKIESIKPDHDPQYGQIITIEARDNLQELLKNTINTDAKYPDNTRRSQLIKDIINGSSTKTGFKKHAKDENIDTTTAAKFKNSSIEETSSNKLDKFLKGSRKNALRVIEEIASEEPLTTNNLEDGARNGNFGFDYFLDETFDGINPTPAFNYFPRGSIPASNPLTLGFGVPSDDNTRAILPNYKFSQNADEIITKVRMEYIESVQDEIVNAKVEVAKTLNVILINHSSEKFEVPGVISWGSNNSAKIEHIINDTSMLISSNINDTWLNTINGQTITSSSGSVSATVDATGSIRENIGQDIEIVYDDFEDRVTAKVLDKAAQILSQSNDAVFRGKVFITQYPYVKIGNEYEIFRAGYAVNLENIPGRNGTSAIITRINYNEGPGVQHTEIELLLHEDGHGISLPANPIVYLANRSEDARFQTIGRLGDADLTTQLPPGIQTNWSYSAEFLPFTNDTSVTGYSNAIKWGAGDLTLPNGNTYKINAGTKDKLPTDKRTHIYFNTDGKDSKSGMTYNFESFNEIKIPTRLDANSIILIAWAQAGTPRVEFQMLGAPYSSQRTAPLDKSIYGYVTNITFSVPIVGDPAVPSTNIINWSAGTVTLSDDTTYNVSDGTYTIPTEEKDDATADGRHYVYLFVQDSDAAGKDYTLNVTGDPGGAAGAFGVGKIVLAVIRRAIPDISTQATFLLYSGDKTIIEGGFIAANTITADSIAANTITSTEIFGGTITGVELNATLALKTPKIILTETFPIDPLNQNSYDNISRIEMDSIKGIVGYGPLADGIKVHEKIRFSHHSGQIIAGVSGGQRLELDNYGIIIYDGTKKDLQITSGRTDFKSKSDSNELYDSDFFPSGIAGQTTSGRIILGDGSSVPRTTLSNTGINLFTSDTTGGKTNAIRFYADEKAPTKDNVKANIYWQNSTETVPKDTANTLFIAAPKLLLTGKVISGTIVPLNSNDTIGENNDKWSHIYAKNITADNITGSTTLTGYITTTGTELIGRHLNPRPTINIDSALSNQPQYDLGGPNAPARWRYIYGINLDTTNITTTSITATNYNLTAADIPTLTGYITTTGTELIGRHLNPRPTINIDSALSNQPQYDLGGPNAPARWRYIYGINLDTTNITTTSITATNYNLTAADIPTLTGYITTTGTELIGRHLIPAIRIIGSRTIRYNLGSPTANQSWNAIYVDNIHTSNIYARNTPSANPRVASNAYDVDNIIFQRQLTDEAAYNAITSKDRHVLYWWPE